MKGYVGHLDSCLNEVRRTDLISTLREPRMVPNPLAAAFLVFLAAAAGAGSSLHN